MNTSMCILATLKSFAQFHYILQGLYSHIQDFFYFHWHMYNNHVCITIYRCRVVVTFITRRVQTIPLDISRSSKYVGSLTSDDERAGTIV